VTDEGPIRDYDTPENKQFIQDLNNGRLPKELAQQFKRDIGIALADRRKENYRPPTPPSYISFSGSGQTLGGQVQAIAGAVDTSKTTGHPAIDPKKPVTTIQFRFHNG
jgi:UBX domain-containing protein 1